MSAKQSLVPVAAERHDARRDKPARTRHSLPLGFTGQDLNLRPLTRGALMKRSVVRSVGCAALLAVTPTVMYAHFRLLEPSSWLVEDARGDPQKAGPCGGTNADWGKPSYVVTKVTGGQKLHIRVQETIYHPGHYRVALAVNSPTELPRDPEVVTVDRADRGRESVSATIQDPPQTPVLADGLWVHKAKVEAPWETDVLLPNVSCRKCRRSMARTIRGTTPIITARTCRLRRTRPSLLTSSGRPRAKVLRATVERFFAHKRRRTSVMRKNCA